MTHKNKITPAASPLYCKHPTWQNSQGLLLTYNIDGFRMCNILKFTQTSKQLAVYHLLHTCMHRPILIQSNAFCLSWTKI